MSKKFQLQIPGPCHEDWNKMTPVDKGRFCDSCQKAVIDFTGMSDTQLIAFFKKPSTGSICGRFFDEQLNRDFEIPRKRIPWLKYLFQFTIPVFLTTLKTQAQGSFTLKESTVRTNLNSCLNSQTILGGMVSFPKSNEITGLIVDQNDNPVPYASVYIKGTKEGTMSDSTGQFKLQNSLNGKKITLMISCIGYSPVEKQINARKDDFTKIRLSIDAVLNGEVVVTGYGTTRKGRVMGAMGVVKISYLQKVKNYFAKKDSINIFPNPAKAGSEIKIEWKIKTNGVYVIDLYTLQGQLIQTALTKVEDRKQVFNFRLPIITPGTYLLRLTNKKSGQNHAEKIIIQ